MLSASEKTNHNELEEGQKKTNVHHHRPLQTFLPSLVDLAIAGLHGKSFYMEIKTIYTYKNYRPSQELFYLMLSFLESSMTGQENQ